MKKIEINARFTSFVKAASLVENYNNGIDKHIGVHPEALNHVTIGYSWQDDPMFAQYLLNNKEISAYLHFFANKPYVSRENIYNALKIKPLVYQKLLIDSVHCCWLEERKEMVDSFFEEFAPQLDQIPLSYLPKQHHNNASLILKLVEKDPTYGRYVKEIDLEKAVKVNHRCLEYKTAKVTGNITLMRKLCAANPECAGYACSPITTKAGVKGEDTWEDKKAKVNAWLTGTGERKALNNASGGGVARVKTPTNQAPKPKFKI